MTIYMSKLVTIAEETTLLWKIGLFLHGLYSFAKQRETHLIHAFNSYCFEIEKIY